MPPIRQKRQRAVAQTTYKTSAEAKVWIHKPGDVTAKGWTKTAEWCTRINKMNIGKYCNKLPPEEREGQRAALYKEAGIPHASVGLEELVRPSHRPPADPAEAGPSKVRIIEEVESTQVVYHTLLDIFEAGGFQEAFEVYVAPEDEPDLNEVMEVDPPQEAQPVASEGKAAAGGSGNSKGDSGFYSASKFRAGDSLFAPVRGTHIFKSWALAPVALAGNVAQGGYRLIRPAALLPTHRMSFWLPEGVHNSMPNGTTVKSVKAVVYNRGVTMSFETAGTTSGTGNTQVPVTGFTATGLEKTGGLSGVATIQRGANNSMVPTNITRSLPDYYNAMWEMGPLGGNLNNNQTQFPTSQGAVRSLSHYHWDWIPNVDHPDGPDANVSWFDRLDARFNAWTTEGKIVGVYQYSPNICFITPPKRTGYKTMQWENFTIGPSFFTGASSPSLRQHMTKIEGKEGELDKGNMYSNYDENGVIGKVFDENTVEKSDEIRGQWYIARGNLEQAPWFRTTSGSNLSAQAEMHSNTIAPMWYVGLMPVQRPSPVASTDTSGWAICQCQWEVQTVIEFNPPIGNVVHPVSGPNITDSHMKLYHILIAYGSALDDIAANRVFQLANNGQLPFLNGKLNYRKYDGDNLPVLTYPPIRYLRKKKAVAERRAEALYLSYYIPSLKPNVVRCYKAISQSDEAVYHSAVKQLLEDFEKWCDDPANKDEMIKFNKLFE
jgi:hypothetical protein